MYPDFDENRKIECRVKKTGNETISEYFKNGLNDFLQTRYINTYLHVFRIY